MNLEPTTDDAFKKWYAANCLLAKNSSKGALRLAWNAAVRAAAEACGQVVPGTISGAYAAQACKERIMELEAK